jgi:hypothetical protein
VLGGTAVIGLGIGTFLGVQARSQWADAQPQCSGGVCNSSGYASWQDSRNNATGATIAFSAAGALAAAGVIVWVTAPSLASPPRVGVGLDRVTFSMEF